MTAARPRPEELFDLELPCAPVASCDGQIAYLKHKADRTEDRVFGELWMIAQDGSHHRRLASEERDIRSFAWSPDGAALIYAARCKPTVDGDSSHRLMRLEPTSGEMSCVAELSAEPRLLTWSPQGERLAFAMQTPHPKPQPVVMPEGATDRWARRARYIEQRFYRLEGAGLIGHSDGLFVVHLSNSNVRRLPGVELRGGGIDARDNRLAARRVGAPVFQQSGSGLAGNPGAFRHPCDRAALWPANASDGGTRGGLSGAFAGWPVDCLSGI